MQGKKRTRLNPFFVLCFKWPNEVLDVFTPGPMQASLPSHWFSFQFQEGGQQGRTKYLRSIIWPVGTATVGCKIAKK